MCVGGAYFLATVEIGLPLWLVESWPRWKSGCLCASRNKRTNSTSWQRDARSECQPPACRAENYTHHQDRRADDADSLDQETDATSRADLNPRADVVPPESVRLNANLPARAFGLSVVMASRHHRSGGLVFDAAALWAEKFS